MSILSVDNISPIGSGTSVTVNSAATLVLTNANSTGVITATSFVGSGANLTGVLKNVVEDTSPQLGGSLDVNGNNISFIDSNGTNNNRATFGTSNDMAIYHDGFNSRIKETGTGHLILSSDGAGVLVQSDNGQNLAKFFTAGATELYHNYSKKIETTNTGAVITGICTATTFEATTFSKTPTNTPAFHAWSSPVISPAIPDATMTKVEFLVTETFDTDNAYDNSSSGTTANRFTVPAGKTGFYHVSAGLNFYANLNDIRHCRMAIKQNGAIKMTAYGFISSYAAGTRHFQCNLSGILQLANDGDYLELFAYLDTNGGSQGYISNDAQGYRGNFFSAFKLII